MSMFEYSTDSHAYQRVEKRLSVKLDRQFVRSLFSDIINKKAILLMKENEKEDNYYTYQSICAGKCVNIVISGNSARILTVYYPVYQGIKWDHWLAQGYGKSILRRIQ